MRRLNPSNPPRRGSGNTKPQGSTRPPPQNASRRIKGRRNDKQSGKERDESGESSFHLFLPQNAVSYHAVIVRIQRGTPTIRAIISGSQKTLILDTGSSISLIQPGVSSNRIRATNVTSFGVTGDELSIKGKQDVELQITSRYYRRSFCVYTLPTDAGGIISIDFFSATNAKLDLENQELWLLKNVKFNHYSLDWRPR